VSHATKSADRISGWATGTAVLACGAIAFFVALPLALSNPFPTPKERDWVIESAPLSPSVPMGRDVQAALEEEAVGDPEAGATETVVTLAALPPKPVKTVTILVPRDADPEPTGSIPTASVPISAPVPKAMPAPPPVVKKRSPTEDIDAYLWDVYRRAPVKRDSSGDFSWKDPAAAKHAGMGLQSYVIGGMDPDFREQLYHAGRAMDSAGLRWSMLSAFRDDYRQRLAAGFKASGGNSLHGGSRRTGGYGHGRAVDITAATGEPEAVWRWIDRNGAKYGLSRPMPGADPAHIQPRSNWRQIAIALRASRTRLAARTAEAR
jgi:hypothetical protein